MKVAVVVFPGSNCDADIYHVASAVLGADARYVWHKETSLGVRPDLVVLPGGFSYGDYLRCGAIARFSPVMGAVQAHAEVGGLVIGICNGFQTLVESGLLPGGLLRNMGLKFVCRYVNLRVENAGTPFTSTCRPGDLLRIIVKHNEGNYAVDRGTLARLKANGQIVLRYADASGELTTAANPNGAVENIAGICNETFNVFGMMPHPENSVEAAVAGGTDGRRIFQSMIGTVLQRADVTA
jgi:phosphoribosylformylglycinamidine synthase